MALVDIEYQDHVAIVKLNRPDKMNALNIEMFEAIITAGKEVSENESVRVVVLCGAGKSFCAGLDLANFTPDPDAEINQSLLPRTHGIANKWQAAVWVWRECPVPVIAVGHGVIFGGGLQIFSAADIKFIHPESRLSIMEMKWGIIPDMGGSQIWKHSVRDDILKELIFTNREFNAQEAVKYGFATHLSAQPLEEALEMANTIASKSPSAIVQAKKLFNEANFKNEADGLMMESALQETIIRKENQLEAVFSALQKRKAKFKDFR